MDTADTIGLNMGDLVAYKAAYGGELVVIGVDSPDHAAADADRICLVLLELEGLGVVVRGPLVLVEYQL